MKILRMLFHLAPPKYAFWGGILFEITFQFLSVCDFTIFLKSNKRAGNNKRTGRNNNLNVVSEHALLLCFYNIKLMKLHIEQAIINKREGGIS